MFEIFATLNFHKTTTTEANTYTLIINVLTFKIFSVNIKHNTVSGGLVLP